MKKSLLVAALIAAACSTAFAGEVTKQTKAPVVKAQTMTDADMDKVTAGAAGFGLYTAEGGPGQGSPQGEPWLHGNGNVIPGMGKCTAGKCGGGIN